MQAITLPCVLMRAGTSRGPFFLRDWLPAVRAADCRLDWAAVRRVDSAALALALELAREAGQHGHSLQHLHLPVEVESLIDLYGLQAFIAAA